MIFHTYWTDWRGPGKLFQCSGSAGNPDQQLCLQHGRGAQDASAGWIKRVSLFAEKILPSIFCQRNLPRSTELKMALVFSSGVAAITFPFCTFSGRNHIVSVRNVYSWTAKLLPRCCQIRDRMHIRGWHWSAEFFWCVKPNTKLIYLESPNTFTFELQELKPICDFAKRDRSLPWSTIRIAVRSSWNHRTGSWPVHADGIQIPGGHSDVIAGVLTGSSKLLQSLFKTTFLNIGGVITPDNAWLILRSLRTMELRLNRISSSTQKVVDHLANHPKVERVIWPFHPSPPAIRTGKKQMKGCGGLFSFVLKTESVDKIEKFCNSLERFLLAVSWGGHESLVIPVCSTIPKKEFNPGNEKQRFVRMYIGWKILMCW